MTEEFLDIVDENNNLTGETALRSKIHAEGIRHRTVHVYVFRKTEKGIEFSVHLRSQFKDTCPNQWDTRFGGHVKAGMTLEQGVASEIKEEIGLDVEEYNLIEGYWRKSEHGSNREFNRVYFFEYNGELSGLKFHDGEVQDVKWIDVESIKDGINNHSDFWAVGIKGFETASSFLVAHLAIGDYKSFLDKIFQNLKDAGFDLDEFKELDHIAYRTESLEAYEEIKENLIPFSETYSDKIFAGRPVLICRLKNPLAYENFKVAGIEVLAPKGNNKFKEGLEHAEFVIKTSLPEFREKHNDTTFNLDAYDRDENPELTVEFGDCAAKFHAKSLLEIRLID